MPFVTPAIPASQIVNVIPPIIYTTTPPQPYIPYQVTWSNNNSTAEPIQTTSLLSFAGQCEAQVLLSS